MICPRCLGQGRAAWIFNREVVDHVRCGACSGTGRIDAPRGRGAKARDRDGDPGRETSDFFPSDPSED
jgi:DnaJ-class molecular chaperone